METADLRQRSGKGAAKPSGGSPVDPRASKKGNSAQQAAAARKRPSSSSAGLYEALGVICLLLAALVAVLAYLHHFEPQMVKQLEDSLVQTCSFLTQLIFAEGDAAQSSPAQSTSAPKKKPPSKLFTLDELRQHDGSDPNKPILLSILGKVYDVTQGQRFYAKGGSYSFFSGRDASRSFATGEFAEDKLSDDVSDLEPEDVAAIHGWQLQFDKQYTYLGKLVGTFYDSAGKPTAALKKVREKVKKAKVVVDQDLEEKQEFPECNSMWAERTGTRVWCSESSGGIERSWKGFPRQFKSAQAKSTRCACVRKKLLNDPRLRAYDGCDPQAHECEW